MGTMGCCAYAPLSQVVVVQGEVQCTGLTSLHIPFAARRLITAMPRLALCSHAQAIASADPVKAPASHAAADRHVPSSKSNTARWMDRTRKIRMTYDQRPGTTMARRPTGELLTSRINGRL